LLGTQLYFGKNNAAEDVAYSQWSIKIGNKSDGVEDGDVEWLVMHDGSLESFLQFEAIGTATVMINRDLNDIGFYVGSAAGGAFVVNGTSGTAGFSFLMQAMAGIFLDDSLKVDDDTFIGLGTDKGRFVFQD